MRMWLYYVCPDMGPGGVLLRNLYCRPLTFAQCFVSLHCDDVEGQGGGGWGRGGEGGAGGL
jgi:hypothetical protein